MGRVGQATCRYTAYSTDRLVLVIISILAAVVMGDVLDQAEKARYAQAQAQIRILENTLKRYNLDNGRFPTTEQRLEALVQRPTIGVRRR